MPQRILMDMIHLQFEAPYDLEKTAYVKIRRTSKNKRLNADLRQMVRSFVRQYHSLNPVRVTVFS